MNTPVRKTMCASCPFRDGSPLEYLRLDLIESALSEASRVCHSTGVNDLFGDSGKPEALCRGARDVQLQFFKAIGFLPEATDAAWSKRRVEMGMTP